MHGCHMCSRFGDRSSSRRSDHTVYNGKKISTNDDGNDNNNNDNKIMSSQK